MLNTLISDQHKMPLQIGKVRTPIFRNHKLKQPTTTQPHKSQIEENKVYAIMARFYKAKRGNLNLNKLTLEDLRSFIPSKRVSSKENHLYGNIIQHK